MGNQTDFLPVELLDDMANAMIDPELRQVTLEKRKGYTEVIAVNSTGVAVRRKVLIRALKRAEEQGWILVKRIVKAKSK